MAKNYFADEPMPTLFTPTVEPVTKQNSQGLFGDAVDTFQSNIFTSLGGVFDFVGADGLAKSMRENSEEQYAEVSQQGKDALAKEFVSEDERGNITLGEGATDLDTWLLTMASVAGQFAGTAIPGAGAAGLAGKAASLGAKGKNIANIASMGATGGAAATGQGMEQARQEVQNMPDTLLAESPLFGDVFRGVHANQPELSNVEKWEAAKTALANKVAQEVRTDPKVLIANFGASAIGDPIIGKALTGARLAKSGALRSALAGFVTEGSTEAVQAGVQQLGVNQALQPIDNRDEMQGVIAAGLNEGLAGGGFGAAAGGVGGLVNRQPRQQTPQTEPTVEPAPQSAVDPVTEQMKASNPNLGEAMASMDQHSTNVKNEVDNLDIPTAARQAGFDTNAGAGQFGDFITSPSQESIQSMRNQSIADMINDAINNIGPTPDDRFSPIKYQHVGELLSPEQSTELQPAPRKNAQIDSGFIDGEIVPEQGLLPTQQQTQNRQAFERVQSEFNNQPAQLESKDIIFGEDGRPRQQAAERVKQAGKSAQNLLPQKDIIFAGNESGVNVARNGKPFKSMKEARNSKLARQAKRQGLTVDVVPFDNGYGWMVNSNNQESAPISAPITETNAQPTANLAGDPIDSEWTAFSEQSETKNIPRAEMPQIKAENRGAMVNFMNARDISHEQDEVPASSLKPTQQEFSPAKVKKAMEFEGGNRSILVSSDNYVLDGHHQWLAAREKGEPVKVIRLNAPIEQLVPLAKEMPSTETQDSNGTDSPAVTEQKPVKRKVFNWDSVELSKNYTANELDQWIKELAADPENKNLAGGIDLYDKPTMKKIDKLSSAVMFLQQQGKENNNISEVEANRIKQEEAKKRAENKKTRLSDIISKVSDQTLTDADKVTATTEPEANEQQSTTNQATAKQSPIESGLQAYDQMADAISNGTLNKVSQVKRVLDYLADNQDSVKAELNKLNKKQLTRMVNGHVWSDTKKAELVNSAYRDMFSRFMFIGNQSSFVSSSSYKLEDKISDAKKHVESLTDQQVAEYSKEQKAKIDAQKERLDQYLDKLKNPQTLDDYKAKIKAQGQDSLTTEQQAEYDKLIAGETIASKNERPTEKEGLKTGGDVELGEPIEGVHGKTGDKIFNVQVISRLGKDAFKEAANFARSMGGGYYKGNFYFKSIEDAELFSGWVNGESVDTTANQEAKAAQRQTKTASRLKEMAERVEERANEALNADRKTNTIKRIGESERAISNAEKELQIASILRDIPSSNTVVIKNATQKVQVELLDLLSRSLVNAAPESQVNKDGNSRRTFKDNITNAEKAKHARMPLKSARAARLNELADQMLDKKGFIILGRKMKSLTKGKRDQDYITINDSTTPKFIEFIEKHASQYDMIRDEAARYKRLERMGITNEPTLRTALIEYMELKSKSEKTNTPNKLNKLEQQLKRTMIGNRNAFNDFFPTPENMASEIASMADIQPGMRVLEPSAGNGLLADAAREQGASVDVVEMGGQLREILQEKGYNLVGSDFLEFTPKADYDRIVMNPPFSNDQDIAHVEHAYKMLKPGGKLVAITSGMAGDRSNKANKSFKEWVDSLDAEQQALPEGAFKSSLNPTNVNTKAIVIEKPSDAPAVQVASDIKFSKSKVKQNAKGVNAEQAQNIADDFIKSLNGANGIKVRILATTAEAEKMWRMSLDGATVKGAYSEMSNTVYVIAENIDSETDLKQTLAHETIAHGGLDTVIGAEAKQAFIDRIKKTKGRKAFEKYWKDANKDYWYMSLDVKAEEIFARFVENEPSKGELKYWWNALKRWIKAQLDKAGIMYREDDELTAMREMLESIVKGFKAQREPMVNNQAEMAYSQSDKKFSRTADNDTRTAKEKLGLEEQARETIADRAKAKTNETVNTLKSSSFWQRLNEGVFDGLAGIKQAEVSAGVTDPNRQGYVSARLASGLADVLHGVFNYGAPVWRDGIIQRKENTKGLLEVFGMVGDDLNNWLAWMGAKRAEKLKEQGRENNLTQADIDELKALANGKEELFEQVRQEYNKVNSAILDVAQGAGLLSEEQRASFDEEYYVPFYRDMGETDAELDDIKRMIVEPHMRKGIASQSAKIKELKGGKQSTKDLLENIIARQSTLIDASLKNKAMQEVTDNLDGTDYMQAETSEEIASLSQQELNKLHRVKVMRNGKAQAYMVSDPALLRALIQVNDVGSQSLFNKMGRSAKRFLTAGITLSPDFIFKNFVRDAAHAWMINKDDFKFGTDSIKGLKKAFKEDEAYRDLIFSGAAFQGGYIHGADPEAAAQQTRRALRSKGLTTNEIDGYLDTVINSGAELLEKYRGISDKVENANRLSTYQAALAAGKSKRQAAYESKDLMDYSLKGNFKLIGTMIDMLPFFNARLQGMSKLVRAAKAGDGDRVLKVLSANLAMKGIKVAGFSLALAAMNDDDERYQELPDWDKDMNWHIFAGDQHFRIPKPFELGIIFGTLPERMLHTATGTQTGGDLGKAVANAVFNTLALNPIPQFALPATEVLVNKSFFKDAPIEGMADENKQAEDRYNTYTSEVAKGIGSTFGVSPKKVEHLIKGYTGTIGGYVLGASDIVARQIMGKETADTPVSRYPVIKAFYQGSGPKGSTKFANDFYESLEAANQAYGSYKRAMEEGDTSRQQELIEGEGDKLRSRIALGRVQRAASKLGKMARAVNDNPNLTGEQKRKQLDDIQRQKNALYHQAYVTFNLGEW